LPPLFKSLWYSPSLPPSNLISFDAVQRL
jgi:hypothetical protein